MGLCCHKYYNLSAVSLTTCPIPGEPRDFTPLLKYLPDVKFNYLI